MPCLHASMTTLLPEAQAPTPTKAASRKGGPSALSGPEVAAPATRRGVPRHVRFGLMGSPTHQGLPEPIRTLSPTVGESLQTRGAWARYTSYGSSRRARAHIARAISGSSTDPHSGHRLPDISLPNGYPHEVQA